MELSRAEPGSRGLVGRSVMDINARLPLSDESPFHEALLHLHKCWPEHGRVLGAALLKCVT